MSANSRRSRLPRSGSPVAAILLLCILGAAEAQLPSESSELYLLDVRSRGFVLADSLPAYANGGENYLELGSLLEAIEFPIARNGPLWSGWFFDESRTFGWQMPTGRVEISGREPATISADQWFETDDGIFVSTTLIGRWFGISLDVDVRQQVIVVRSEEPLPFELWHERTLAKYRFRSGTDAEPDVIVPDQYNWATQPLVNVSSQFVTRNEDGLATTSHTTSVTAGMDLLKHSVVLSSAFTRSSGDIDQPDDSSRRLTVDRFSETPHRPIFGDVHHYTFGDIYQGRPNLVTSANTGRGFAINRYSDMRSGNLSSVTITNNAPPGWEVELYRNGTLIDFATVGADGRYFFDEQDIQFGENVFVAKLFGPQGQSRDDQHVFWGGGIELAAGDYDYSVSHIDFSEHLLDGPPQNHEGLSASFATDFRYTRAISSDVEVGGAFTRAGVGTRERDGTYIDHNYLTAFGRARLGPGVLIGEVVEQLDAGHALSLEYLTGFGGHTYSFAQRVYDDYQSPATVHREPLDGEIEFSALGYFGPNKKNGYRAGIRRRALSRGGADYRLFSRVGTRLGAVNLTNELEHAINVGSNLTYGRLRLAGRVRKINIRGQVDYELGGSPLKRVAATLYWALSPRLNNNLTVAKHLDEADQTFLTNQVSYRFRDFDLTFGISSDFDREWSVAAGVNVAFGYDSRLGSFVTDYGPLAHTGRATMNLFVDENNNGLRDFGEPPVTAASYRDRAMAETTPGKLTLSALPSETPVQIHTRHFKFDDPFLLPKLDAYEVRTHAGSDIEIDIPIVLTGDVEGTIYDSHGVPVRGVTVTLVDPDGADIADARSEFDGYYSFTGIPAGDYRIAIQIGENEREILMSVTLDTDKGYVVADDIRLPAILKETSQ